MSQALIFAFAVGIYAFAALVVWQHYNAIRHLPRALLAFLGLLAVNFIFKAWIHIDESPLKALALSLMFISTHLLPYTILAYAKGRQSDLPTNPATAAAVTKMAIALTAAGIASSLPLMSTMHLGSDYQGLTPISQHRWWWTNAASLLSVGCFALVAGLVLGQTYITLKKSQKDERFPWLTAIPNMQLNTLKLMFLTLAAVWLVGIASAIHCLTLGPPSIVSLLMSLALVGVSVATLSYLVRPQDTPTRAGGLAQYSRSGLAEKDLQRIQRKLDQAMSQERLFQNGALTLAQLAERIGEKSPYISQCLNQSYGCNFFDYVNGFRIKHAQELLIADPDTSVIAISENVGFHSKSTFYTAFRKVTGATPNQYRKQAQQLN